MDSRWWPSGGGDDADEDEGGWMDEPLATFRRLKERTEKC